MQIGILELEKVIAAEKPSVLGPGFRFPNPGSRFPVLGFG